MFCTHCGTRLDDAAKFCMNCGKSTAPDAPPPPPPPGFDGAYAAAPPRRLRRVMQGKKIAGVCGGFAEYFDMDPTLMRLIWVALALTPPGIALIAYPVAWAVLPKE